MIGPQYPWPHEKDGKPLVGWQWGSITSYRDGQVIREDLPVEPVYGDPRFAIVDVEPRPAIKPWVAMNNKPAWLRNRR
jgi:hypothetical protein